MIDDIKYLCTSRIKPIQVQSEYDVNKSDASFLTNLIWPSGSNIKCAFMSADDEKESIVRDIVFKNYVPLLGSITLEFISDFNQADIRIMFDKTNGAWSYIGTSCLTVPKDTCTMNLGWVDERTVLHEFGHALGMVHEHQNNCDNIIEWNKNVIYNWAMQTQGWDKYKTDVNIINRYPIEETNGSTYDPESIMHYYFPTSFTKNQVACKLNTTLSLLDKQWILKTYHC